LKVEHSAKGQGRELATAKVYGGMMSRVLGDKHDQSKLLDAGRFREEFGTSCGNREVHVSNGAGTSVDFHPESNSGGSSPCCQCV
jgi:hypothetical protein